MIKWFERHSIFSWTITIAIAIIIFYVSSLSFEYGTPGPDWKIKPILYHFTIFALLSFFLVISIIKGQPKNKKLILLALIIAVIYAISDEVHQLFVPGRYCAISDILTDSAGIFFAGLFYVLRLTKIRLL
jgi:VanZ family protein